MSGTYANTSAQPLTMQAIRDAIVVLKSARPSKPVISKAAAQQVIDAGFGHVLDEYGFAIIP